MDQNHEVEGVKFETDSYKAVKFYDETNTPKIVQWVMKISGGAIKEQKQAEYVLFGFVIVALIVSLFLVFWKVVPQKPKIIPQFREDIEPGVRAKLPPGVFETIPSKYDQVK